MTLICTASNNSITLPYVYNNIYLSSVSCEANIVYFETRQNIESSTISDNVIKADWERERERQSERERKREKEKERESDKKKR